MTWLSFKQTHGHSAAAKPRKSTIGRWFAYSPFHLSPRARLSITTPPAAMIAPQQIRLADDIHLASEAWPSARWWKQYNDPQLDALVELALAHAPTLAIAQEHVSQAAAQVELIRAASRPADQRNGECRPSARVGSRIPQRLCVAQSPIGAYGPWYSSGLLGLAGHYDVDIWGKQRDQVRAAIGEQNAQRAEAAQAELELSAGVARLYYTIQTAYASLDLLQQLREVQAFELAADLREADADSNP